MIAQTNRWYLVRLRPGDPQPAVRVEAANINQAYLAARRVLPVELMKTATIEEE